MMVQAKGLDRPPAGGLQIHPDNPHYFVYQGKPKFLVTYGDSLDLSGGQPPEGTNHKTILLMTTQGRPFNPYASQTPFAGEPDHVIWNEATWAQMRDYVQTAAAAGKIIGIGFWSTPMIERGEGRWDTHFWNSCNGGPIPSRTCGDGSTDAKDDFYSLDSYGSEITDPYNPDWSWKKRNQYRQEELVKKYLTVLQDFPNVYYYPMFEIGDHYGSSIEKAHRWHQHIAKVIRKYQPDRLIATVAGTRHERFLAEWNEVDFLLFEGPATAYLSANQDLRDRFWNHNKPLVWQFLYMPSSLNPTTYEEEPLRKMREAMREGLHPSTLIRSGCDEVTFENGQQAVNRGAMCEYGARLAAFVTTIDNWCDEPGQEITDATIPPVTGGKGIDLPAGTGCRDEAQLRP
jgi:hypothetical protein